MTPEREERGPRQKDPASRLRSEPLNKAPSAKLRPDAKGKAPDRPRPGPSWKQAAARAGDPVEQTARLVAPPVADAAEEQAPDRPQGAVPVLETSPGVPKWRARAAVTAGAVGGSVSPKADRAASGQVVPKSPSPKAAPEPDPASGKAPCPDPAPDGVPGPARPSDKLHEKGSALRHDPESKLHPEDGGGAGPGSEAPAAPAEGGKPKERKAGDTIRRWQKEHGPKAEGHDPGPAKAARASERVETPELHKATKRVEKRGGKLEKAQGKLAKQKPIKRPGPVKQVTGYAGRTLHGFVHGKVYESEHENVGLEGAHRVELVGEAVTRSTVRTVKSKVRQHPAKAAQRAESRYTKAKAEQVFQQTRLEHPDLTRDKGAMARMWRKRRLKKQYQKQAQEAAKKTAQGTATVTEKIGKAVANFVKQHPTGCVVALLVVLLLLVLQSCMSSITAVGNGVVCGMGASTYAAEDTELIGAENAYVALEAELQDYLDRYTSTHSYDEYHFDLDEIEHDPYVLLAILSAFHDGDWSLADVQGDLQTIFDRQYILTERVVRETRYDTETRTDDEGSEYEVEVPYSYYICTVTLENFNMSHLPVYMMSTDQLSRYAIYMASLGNRPDLFPTSGYVGKYGGPVTRYDIPPEALEDEKFAAMIKEAEKYLGFPYVWGGSSPSTSFDCSGFVSWVVNHCGVGWNFGRCGSDALYFNVCTPIAPSEAKPGDLIFFQKTYDTPNTSHVGIYVGNGMMLHCGDPIQYTSINTSYWQAHFYGFGRLPSVN